MKVSRRRGRTLAFQTLFELETRPERSIDETLDQRVAVLLEENGGDAPGRRTQGFAADLVRGTVAHRLELDRHIARVAPAFPIEQMALTDRVTLELATYEMLFRQEVPVSIVINEAVELAKTFGGENSGRFVNGVLGTIAGELDEESAEVPSPRYRDKSSKSEQNA